MDEGHRKRFVEAFAFAVHAHAGQTRKGSQVPYTSHIVQVAGLVLEFGGDSAQAIAGLLHDVLEDCDVELETLQSRFGHDVATIVQQCTDLLPGDRPEQKSPWIERKERYLAQLREADARCLLVVACDKLHNLRSVISDLRQDGAVTLDRFTSSPAQTRWYYESVRETLTNAVPGHLLAEMDALLGELGEYVPD